MTLIAERHTPGPLTPTQVVRPRLRHLKLYRTDLRLHVTSVTERLILRPAALAVEVVLVTEQVDPEYKSLVTRFLRTQLLCLEVGRGEGVRQRVCVPVMARPYSRKIDDGPPHSASGQKPT